MSTNNNDKQDRKPMSISLTTGYEEDDEISRRVGPASFGSISFQTHTVNPEPLINTAPLKTAPPTLYTKPPALKGIWELKDVPSLPEFHPLERSAVFVPHSNPMEVSSRISDVLRQRSIEAIYCNDKAKAKCLTADGVDFRVRMYRGRKSYAHGIIVEVQRRFGTSVNFYKDSMAILDAAEGKKVPPPPPASRDSIPLVSDYEDDYEINGSSSLAMVAKMFGHKGFDSHYLAFQTLLPLTDASKIGSKTAKAVSKELLRDGNEVGSIIRSLVLAKKEEDDMFKLRSNAMTVLANSIKVVRGHVDMSLREELRPALLEELYNSEKNPRTAQMAAQCIEYLIDGDHDVDELQIALEKAEQVGEARHAGLKFQAARCLKKINGGLR